MQFGINLMLFDGHVGNDVLDRFPRIRSIGFDVVEIPIFDPESLDVTRIRAAAERNGLAVTASSALPPGMRFYGDAPEPVARAQAFLRSVIDIAHALGSPLLCGPLYKTVGDADLSLPLDAQRDQAVTHLKPVLAHAEAAGITLAFEPLNRFETNFLNTTAQGIAFCDALDSPGARLLLDTFHMHIEEKNSPAALGAALERGMVGHVHLSENDRGTPGTGQVAWDDLASVLRGANYDGPVVLETFSDRVESIRTAVSCWRPFYDSPEEFMTAGLAFVREKLG